VGYAELMELIHTIVWFLRKWITEGRRCITFNRGCRSKDLSRYQPDSKTDHRIINFIVRLTLTIKQRLT